MDYLNERQGLILQYLREQGAASVREVKEQLGFSSATIYRDIHTLANMGLVHHSHGRLVFRQQAGVDLPMSRCVMCGGVINLRTAVTIHMDNGRQAPACCPHCGLMYISKHSGADTALATDFLYGKMHNIRQAVYLLESQVQICCSPSLLCFASREDAVKFQTGFGGSILDFEQALHTLHKMMAINPGMPRNEED